MFHDADFITNGTPRSPFSGLPSQKPRSIKLPQADPKPLPRFAMNSCVLTPRQLQVLAWIAEGKTDWETGEILMISRKTVNYHVECAKQRLNARTRMQAALIASRLGLIAGLEPAGRFPYEPSKYAARSSMA